MILIRATILTSLTAGVALIYAGAWPWLDMSGLAVPALLGAMLVLHVAARLTAPQPEPEPPLPPLPQPRRPLPAPARSAFLLPLGEGVDGVAMPSPASPQLAAAPAFGWVWVAPPAGREPARAGKPVALLDAQPLPGSGVRAGSPTGAALRVGLAEIRRPGAAGGTA